MTSELILDNQALILRRIFPSRKRFIAWGWTSDGKGIFGLENEGGLYRWNWAEESNAEQILSFEKAPSLCHALPDGTFLLADENERDLHQYAPKQAAPQATFCGHEAPLSALTVSSDGARFYSADQQGWVRVWCGTASAFQHPAPPVEHLALRPDGQTLLSAGRDDTLVLWQMSETRPRPLIISGASSKRITSTAALPTQCGFMTGGAEGHIQFWDAQTGALLPPSLQVGTRPIRGLAFSPDGALMAAWTEEPALHLWRCDTWDRVFSAPFALKRGTRRLPSRPVAFHPRLPLLAVLNNKAEHILLYEINLRALLFTPPAQASPRYASARLALVGDPSVGKSALGLRLVSGGFQATEATHGQQIWRAPRLVADAPQGDTQREVVLWDFAGQSDYRLLHRLFLNRVDLALVLFETTERHHPLQGAEYWLKQLKKNAKGGVNAILVGTKSDVGAPRLSNRDLMAFCARYKISGGYVLTSAKKGSGLQELIESIQRELDWSRLPTSLASATFYRIRAFVLALKEDPTLGRKILPLDELGQRLSALLEDFSPAPEELQGALQALETHGFVLLLQGADGRTYVLLQPDVLINLAASYLVQARQHELGLGALDEGKLLQDGYRFPEAQGLRPDELKLLRHAIISLFVENHLCFREFFKDRNLLIFPSLINEKKPYHEHDLREDVGYRLEDDSEALFASLVVQMTYSLDGESVRLYCWQDQAEFHYNTGEICGFIRRELPDDPEACDLTLYFNLGIHKFHQQKFMALFENALDKAGKPYLRYPVVTCADCGYPQDRQVVVGRLKHQSRYLHCVECGQRIYLQVYAKRLEVDDSAQPRADKQKGRAYLRTSYELILGRVLEWVGAKAKPTCFISYTWDDAAHRERVKTLVNDLQKAHIEVTFDAYDNPDVGSDIARFISTLDAAQFVLVIGTPLYRTKTMLNTQTASIAAAELDLIQSRLMGVEEQKASVLPLLFGGEEKQSFPPLLHGRVYADFRQERFYYNNLFKLICAIHELPLRRPDVEQLSNYLHESSRQAYAQQEGA